LKEFFSMEKNDAVELAQLVVSKTQAEVKAARRVLANLLEKRTPLAVQAPGDGEISAALKANRESIVDAELQIVDAQTRLDQAEKALVVAITTAANVDAAAKLAEAREIVRKLLIESEAFDRHIAEAGAALERRERLRMQLRATGCLARASDSLGARWRVRAALAPRGIFARSHRPSSSAGARPG
jgi:hypothetical protein